ncbi:MAG: LemA family protein [Elusimicrobia bacterium]|nr:LemA family protein [Elusimicrobiota bacterium]
MTVADGAELSAAITSRQFFTIMAPMSLLLLFSFVTEEIAARDADPIRGELNIVTWVKRRIVAFRAVSIALVAAFYAYEAAWWYNMDMSELNSMAMSRAQVGKEFQRREDLITNLDIIVNNYANHERILFEHVSDMRAQLQAMEMTGGVPSAAQNFKIEQAFISLMALAEQYPNLKAEQRFHELMDMAEITENRIAEKLNTYLKALMEFNTCNQHFWCNYWTFFGVAQLVPMPAFFEYYYSNSKYAPTVPAEEG